MAHLCRRPGLAQKTKPRRFISEISLADDFQRHRAVQIDIEGLVSDPHGTTTQLDWFPIFADHQFVILKALQCPYWRRLDRFLERRLAGLNPTSKTLAEHAYRAEFHRSREFI